MTSDDVTCHKTLCFQDIIFDNIKIILMNFPSIRKNVKWDVFTNMSNSPYRRRRFCKPSIPLSVCNLRKIERCSGLQHVFGDLNSLIVCDLLALGKSVTSEGDIHNLDILKPLRIQARRGFVSKNYFTMF